MNAPAVRIRFDDVSVEFPTDHGPMWVLDGVSFDVMPVDSPTVPIADTVSNA